MDKLLLWGTLGRWSYVTWTAPWWLCRYFEPVLDWKPSCFGCRVTWLTLSKIKRYGCLYILWCRQYAVNSSQSNTAVRSLSSHFFKQVSCFHLLFWGRTVPKKLTQCGGQNLRVVPPCCHFDFGHTTSASYLCFVSPFPLSWNEK